MTSTVVDTFYILDFDRCLGDTTKLQALLEASIEHLTDIGPSQLAEARKEVELSGGSFDAATYVKEMLGDDLLWDKICSDMITRAQKEDVLEPGAEQLLDELRSRGVKFGILTYGGTVWQRTKLAAANLADIPTLITNDSGKGRVIATWQQDGHFLIPIELASPQIMAKTIMLIDDKALSFKGIPKGVSGFHVLRSDRAVMPSQKGELPENVTRVNGLQEVIKLLFSK